jgi:tryptophan 2,3-dioxygenase
MALTYHSYLQIESLLALQKQESPEEHDEMLFIIIHQAYELWFKELLHEIDYVNHNLTNGSLDKTYHTLKRILTILKVLVHQVDILETMTPLEFLSFRDYLQTASGFQSYQWREIEFVLGKKSPKHLNRFPEDSEIYKKLKKRLDQPSVWHLFVRYLSSVGYKIPTGETGKPGDSVTSSEAVRKALKDVYYNRPEIARFCELLVDLDEGIQEWRYRHVKMVERTIGSKTGTGGSPGVEYLKETLFSPLFPDLWAIRSEFQKPLSE